jgi:hypothetical protein
MTPQRADEKVLHKATVFSCGGHQWQLVHKETPKRDTEQFDRQNAQC